MLVDRDFEMALLNLQVSKINNIKTQKKDLSNVKCEETEDQTGLSKLVDAAKAQLENYDPL